MVKDYSLNPTATAESEDDEDPRTPTSISSQGSQGYDSSASSDFVDVEGFTVVPDSSMNELNIQVMRLDFTGSQSTVKPLYNDHPGDPEFMVIVKNELFVLKSETGTPIYYSL